MSNLRTTTRSALYVELDEQNRIVAGWNAAVQPWRRSVAQNATYIGDGNGTGFRLFAEGSENPALFHQEHRIPLYKYEDGMVVKCTEEEIEADIAALPVPEKIPNQLDQIEAQLVYTAMMTDTLLEEV